MKAPLGKILPSKKKTFNFIIGENNDELKVNFFLLSKQGTGKTNMLMLKVFYLYKAFIESGGKEGCIPIIFAPMFEYAKMSVPTNLENKEGSTPSGAKPQGIESLQYAFAMSNVPEYIKEDINLIALDFTSLTTEDIGVFAGISGNLDALGRVGKILARLKENKGDDYSIDDFLEAVVKDQAVFNACHYVFTKLKESGLFDPTLPRFDWLEALKQKKPIVFNFGDINSSQIYQALGGILLNALWKTSNKFTTAVYKKARKVSDPTIELTEDDEFFINSFVIGLFFEEAHQFFPPTTTKVLRSFPAHHVFKQISMQMGRKRGFKYNFLITQRLELIYKEFRSEWDYILLGSKTDGTDREQLYNFFKRIIPDYKLARQLAIGVCKNDKFEFCIVNLHDVANGKTGSITQFMPFLAPMAQ